MSPSPDPQDTEELKPCPFCGVLPLSADDVDEVTHPSNDCPAISGLWFTRAAWNHRPDSPVTVMELAALAGAENWEVGPCYDSQGRHVNSWDIWIKPEPGAIGVA